MEGERGRGRERGRTGGGQGEGEGGGREEEEHREHHSRGQKKTGSIMMLSSDPHPRRAVSRHHAACLGLRVTGHGGGRARPQRSSWAAGRAVRAPARRERGSICDVVARQPVGRLFPTPALACLHYTCWRRKATQSWVLLRPDAPGSPATTAASIASGGTCGIHRTHHAARAYPSQLAG
jgi:hypothetical protein